MFDIIRPGRTALETGGQLQHTLVFFILRVKRFNIYTILQFNELFFGWNRLQSFQRCL